jgi:hypothetical protein
MKLCFVSVNGPRETYFVDEPRTFSSHGIVLAIIINFTPCENVPLWNKNRGEG